MSDHAADTYSEEEVLNTETAAPVEDTSRTFRLEDFSTGAESADAASSAGALEAPARLDPYTDQEIAQVTAFLFGFGLPFEVMDDYTKAYISRALPLLGVLQAGDALAELGIHKGAGVGQAPAWLRAAAAGVGLGVVGIMARREFMPKGGAADGDDWSSGLGADGPGAGGGAADA